jgi:predicted RNA binding protein YcfA (HicA-like mRNA interferase family)
MYVALTAMFTPDCHKMKMEECGFFLAHSLMKQDDAIRTIVPDHPNPKNTFNFGTNYKVRRNAKAVIAKGAPFGPSTLQRPNNIERGVMRKIGNICEECKPEHRLYRKQNVDL